MSRGFESPLRRAAQTGKVGGKNEDEASQPQTNGETQKHHNVLTQSHTDVKTPDQRAMKRQTVYMPEDLAMWLKIHAASTKDDISGIITRLTEEYREKIEGKR